MVRSNLEYCTPLWNPHHKDQVHKVEMVQRRTARFTTNRYRNISSDHFQWESLEARRCKIQLTLFYKVVHDLVYIPASSYLTPSTARTRSSHTKKFSQFSPSTDCFKFSLWNPLPAVTAEAPSLVSSKEGLSTISF